MILNEPVLESVKDANVPARLAELFKQNRDKRIVVVATTCSGKSTLLKMLPEAVDMDDLVFPLLSKAEADYVCQKPWTPEIGQTMNRLTKERVKVVVGQPVFGTIVLDSDLIIYLKIADELLQERAQKRGSNFIDVKNMQKQIEAEIETSITPIIELLINK